MSYGEGRRSAVPAESRQLLEKLLGSLPQSAAVSPVAKPSRSKVSTSPAKPDASAKASPSKSVAADSKSGAKHKPSLNAQDTAKAKAAESPKQESAERVPTGGLKKSALPEHLGVNGSTPSRVESGELMEEAPSRGGSVKPRLANGETRAPREGILPELDAICGASHRGCSLMDSICCEVQHVQSERRRHGIEA